MAYRLDIMYGEVPELQDYVAKFGKPIQSIALTHLIGANMPGKPPPDTPLYALGILHWVDEVDEKPAEQAEGKAAEEAESTEKGES